MIQNALEALVLVGNAAHWAAQHDQSRYEHGVTYDKNITQIRTALESMEWRPISTAPKNGGMIILFGGPEFAKFVTAGYWSESPRHEKVGWISCGHPFEATHWMPLPPQPTEAEGGKG